MAIPPGTTRGHCLPVGSPLIPTSQDINRIYLSWDDATDYVCGVLDARTAQLFPFFRTPGPSTGTSGSLRFSRKVFRQPDSP